MRKLKLIKVIGNLLIAVSVLALNPIGASAEWRQDDNGWWYSDGSSWSVGQKRIGENVYYFDANGYMSTGWKEINGKWKYFDDNGCNMKETGIAWRQMDLCLLIQRLMAGI